MNTERALAGVFGQLNDGSQRSGILGPTMRLRVFRPPPPLASLVESLWSFEGSFAHRFERILPGGTVQILINLHEDELRWYDDKRGGACHRMSGQAICGPHTRSFRIDTAEQQQIMGINFRLGGVYPFMRAPTSALHNAHVDLDDLWGRPAPRLRERLLDQRGAEARLLALSRWLGAQLRRAPAPCPLVTAASLRLGQGDRVTTVARDLGVTTQRLCRSFNRRVGLPPKRYARLSRFQRTLARLGESAAPDWAELAAELGYCDQAHLIHEFREFAGTTPGSFVARSPQDLNHVPVDG